jgi:hypothetical protein
MFFEANSMTSVEILAILRETPFEPLRIHVSDGSFHDVYHPDQVLVTQRLLIIGLRDPDFADSPEPPDRYARVDTYHVTQMTPLSLKT